MERDLDTSLLFKSYILVSVTVSNSLLSNRYGMEKWYENKMGQDRANISHIPCLDINDRVII
ncbi:unnamed protein product [Prunus armeniaca]